MTKNRLTRILAGTPLLLAGIATTAFFGSSTVLASSPSSSASVSTNSDKEKDKPPETSSKPHGHHSLSCSPEEIPKGGKCTLVWTDKKDDGSSDANQTVTFTSNGGSAPPAKTDKNGRATSTFTATKCGNVTVTGTDNDGSAQTVVEVTCGSKGCEDKDKDSDCDNGGSGDNSGGGNDGGGGDSSKSKDAAAQLSGPAAPGGILGVLGLLGGVSLGSVGARLLRPRRRL